MQLHKEWISFDTAGAPTGGYLVRPQAAQGPLPGVIVIQEVWGVDPHIQDVTERFAQAGYAALAVDLFSIGGKPEALSAERVAKAKAVLDTLPPPSWWLAEERDKALAQLQSDEAQRIAQTFGLLMTPQRPWDQYLAALRGGVAFLQRTHSQGRKVGSVGFCMGGSLSLLLASKEQQLSAAVVFYGAALPQTAFADVRCPVLGLYAEHDPRITGALPQVAEAMKAAGKQFEHHVLPGTPHAFFNDSRAASYRVEAAREAWARTLGFFDEQLGKA